MSRSVDNAFVIKPMTPDDLRAVLEIERESFAAEHAERLLLEELDRDFAALDLMWRESVDGRAEVVGYCNHWLVHDEVHLLSVATRKSAQRQGIGRLLVEHLVAFARGNHCSVITLEVRRSNLAAIALYEATGFELTGVRKKYYPGGEDALVMLLALDSATSESS